MIDRKELLADLKPLLRDLEADLRRRCDEVPDLDSELRSEYEQAHSAGRVGVSFEQWRTELITQVAVAWVLSCVFARFLEDNALVSPPRVSGPVHGIKEGQGLQRARDERDLYFRAHPVLTDRDYLLSVFDDLGRLPGAKDVFGRHNPVSAHRNWLSGDAAQGLIAFFQRIDVDGTGELLHDFRDDLWDTRFLGDLYQDLSEAARKKYALLQTPVFVEEFILERTLEPAIDEFGLEDFKMIDPACGSGHFLLGSFTRILEHWRKSEPATSQRELVARTIEAVNGVDLNPFAVAITRFRLLLAAMKECDITRLSDAPAFEFNLACGDSLLHGVQGPGVLGFHELAHHFHAEDISTLRRILRPGQYEAVVANPPYITVKDRVLSQAYRARYPEVCYRKYSLAVPFMQRLFELARRRGLVGQITANSFMKREFGKRLVESYLPRVDTTHVIDTSGVYLPGHGTPTVILFGRNCRPVATTVRTVMGIKGEPSAPDDPSQGLVWTAILGQIDQPGTESEFVTVDDKLREQFHGHPWSIGGGGPANLKALLDDQPHSVLRKATEVMGVFGMTNADEVMLAPEQAFARRSVESTVRLPVVTGGNVREWSIAVDEHVLFPYIGEELVSVNLFPGFLRWVWRCRTTMGNRATFSKATYFKEGRPWWEWHLACLERIRSPLSIVFGSVASHNHFALDRGQKVFKQSAPLLKLPDASTEEDHMGILGLLNSSTACFWMKQVFFPKGGNHVGQDGARVRQTWWDERYDFASTGLEPLPMPATLPVEMGKRLDALASKLAASTQGVQTGEVVPTLSSLQECQNRFHSSLGQMTSYQEELDWECYSLFGLLPGEDGAFVYQSPPPVELGQRAFEIVLARRVKAGKEQVAWFERHGSTPTTEIPQHWPMEYKQVVERRIQLIESDRNIGLMERPEYKRRWNIEPWEIQQERALRNWLLGRLESYFDIDGRMNEDDVPTAKGHLSDRCLTSVAMVTDIAKRDADFMAVAELFTDRKDFQVVSLVGELMASESVPCLPVLRYRPSGVDKRAAWEGTWELQRLEDAIDAVFDVDKLASLKREDAENRLGNLVKGLPLAEGMRDKLLASALRGADYVGKCVGEGKNLSSEHIIKPVTDAARRIKATAVGDIPVPPKYAKRDFLDGDYWRLRGKLDVPKERWVSFPGCEGQDGTLVVGWAGYDHLQLARAVAERYEEGKEREGRKLVQLLSAIGHLLPWLKQWHNETDPTYGTRMGDYFEVYLTEEAKSLGMSVEQVMAWEPEKRPRKRRRKRRGVQAD